MNDVINLNKARKKKARVKNDKRARGNRMKFGRTKAEKARDEKESSALARHVEEHKREDGE